MHKLRLDSILITERLAKAFVGDVKATVPFPYRSGPSLVGFFNFFGFHASYGSGFPTRWVYAEDCIKKIIAAGRLNEFIDKALSIEELVSLDGGSLASSLELRADITAAINEYVFSLTDYEVVLTDDGARLRKRESVASIGEGFYARVYPVIVDGKKYAKKQLKEEFLSQKEAIHRFRREFEIMESLNDCPYTISVYNFNEQEHSFTMDFAEKTLGQFVTENHHTMTLQWKEYLCEQIILGLMEVHRTSLLHRDLSYNNILIVNNEPKLADFGLGKDATQDYSFKTQTEAGVGTQHFTDPRQLLNVKNASVQTDIYSLGMIIDFVMCGSIVSHDHKYSGLVKRATHPDLEKRYRAVAELYDAFQSIKNSNLVFDPVAEIIKMCQEQSISMEKLHDYFTRKDRGNTLFNLILKDRGAAIEALEIFTLQYEYEADPLLRDMFAQLRDERLVFADYDNFGYTAMNTLLNLSNNMEAMQTCADIIDYCADVVNRFNIQKLRKEQRNNPNIPYEIRMRWLS
ncbi:protein kinase [Alicyclobacillus sp. TC]|uniref:protein kinase domain-containing protein n=1 Tax=Alicyclobacillus sp. TC TaxID=2606450 RepID=UPI00193477AE|nr:protein kinase [Alicyclobacillus sp. TC]QRF22554.1 protein kinase [Alicyclobacillus sp. TC]